MSVSAVPIMLALVSEGSPKENGAGALDQPESLKTLVLVRQRETGEDASARPLKKSQVEFDCTRIVRASSVTLQPAPTPLNGLGGEARSVMPCPPAQVKFTRPEGGCERANM